MCCYSFLLLLSLLLVLSLRRNCNSEAKQQSPGHTGVSGSKTAVVHRACDDEGHSRPAIEWGQKRFKHPTDPRWGIDPALNQCQCRRRFPPVLEEAFGSFEQ